MELLILLTGMLGGFTGFVTCYIAFRITQKIRRRVRRRSFNDELENEEFSVITPTQKGCSSPQAMIDSLVKEIDYELQDLRNGKYYYRIFLRGSSYTPNAIEGAIQKFRDAGWPIVEIRSDKKGLLCILKMNVSFIEQ